MNRILLGYFSGISKHGNFFLKLRFAIPCSEKNIANGSVGYWTKEEYGHPDVIKQLKPEMIMQPVELTLCYSDYGTPQISGIKVVK